MDHHSFIPFTYKPMEEKKPFKAPNGILKSDDLYKYVLETNVYPHELEPLKELRALSATHPWAVMCTPPDVALMMSNLLKLTGAKRTIEIGVFTGYSLLSTALTIPEDGKIVAIDMSWEAYEIGRPIIQKAGVEHKIDFIKSNALLYLDELLKNPKNEASFDYAFVDADKPNNINYHERIVKLLKVNGIVVYDKTLWYGYVSQPEDLVPQGFRDGRIEILKLNEALATDPRVGILTVPVGFGVTICRRLY